MIKSCPITRWSVIQIPFKYGIKFSPAFRPPFENGGLNTKLQFEYQTSEYQTSKSSLFQCFQYSDVCYSDLHHIGKY